MILFYYVINIIMYYINSNEIFWNFHVCRFCSYISNAN